MVFCKSVVIFRGCYLVEAFLVCVCHVLFSEVNSYSPSYVVTRRSRSGVSQYCKSKITFGLSVSQTMDGGFRVSRVAGLANFTPRVSGFTFISSGFSGFEMCRGLRVWPYFVLEFPILFVPYFVPYFVFEFPILLRVWPYFVLEFPILLRVWPYFVLEFPILLRVWPYLCSSFRRVFEIIQSM